MLQGARVFPRVLSLPRGRALYSRRKVPALPARSLVLLDCSRRFRFPRGALSCGRCYCSRVLLCVLSRCDVCHTSLRGFISALPVYPVCCTARARSLLPAQGCNGSCVALSRADAATAPTYGRGALRFLWGYTSPVRSLLHSLRAILPALSRRKAARAPRCFRAWCSHSLTRALMYFLCALAGWCCCSPLRGVVLPLPAFRSRGAARRAGVLPVRSHSPRAVVVSRRSRLSSPARGTPRRGRFRLPALSLVLLDCSWRFRFPRDTLSRGRCYCSPSLQGVLFRLTGARRGAFRFPWVALPRCSLCCCTLRAQGSPALSWRKAATALTVLSRVVLSLPVVTLFPVACCALTLSRGRCCTSCALWRGGAALSAQGYRAPRFRCVAALPVLLLPVALSQGARGASTYSQGTRYTPSAVLSPLTARLSRCVPAWLS